MATSLTLALARTLVRTNVRDTSTVNPGLLDATYLLKIEEARQFYASLYPEQATKRLGFLSTIAGGNVAQVTITTGNIEPRNITLAVIETVAGPYRPLEPVYDLGNILALQDTVQTQGEPTKYVAVRSALSDTIWDVYFHPIPDQAYVVGFFGTFEPALLTGDSDLLLFGFHGSRVIARIAAVECAILLGRPSEFVQALANMLPEKIQTRMAEDGRYMRPLAHAGKSKT